MMIRRYLVCALCFTAALIAQEGSIEKYLTSESDPLSLIEGVVNMRSGHLVQIARDIEAATSIDPLVIYRYYDAGHDHRSHYGCRCGLSLPLKLKFIPCRGVAYLEQRTGSYLPFTISKWGRDGWRYSGRISSTCYTSGYTNCCEALLRGEPDLASISLLGNENCFEVSLGDGTKRIYQTFYKKKYEECIKMRLVEERLPSGNRRHYRYVDRDTLNLKSITTTNTPGSVQLNSFQFSYHEHNITIGCNNQQQVHYAIGPLKATEKLPFIYNQHFRELCLNKITYRHQPAISYRYSLRSRDRFSLFRIEEVTGPSGRQLIIHLDKNNKVKKLYVGNAEEPRYTFTYHAAHNSVTNALGGKTHYHYREQLIDSVEDPVATHSYKWSNQGRLTTQVLKSPSGRAIITRRYQYDNVGSITRATISGAISGDAAADDSYSVDYHYLDGAYHLLMSEEHNSCRQVRYRYLFDTNLVNQKYHSHHGRCYKREFYNYDDNHVVTGHSVDDGSHDDPGDMRDVTCRLYTETLPHSDPASASMTLPSIVTDYSIDLITQAKQQLRATHYLYNSQGLVVEEQIFDADNHYRYSRHYDYNDYRQCTKISNAIGEETHYRYDPAGNKIFEARGDKKVHFKYDSAHNLIEEAEEHSDGLRLVTTHEYDLMGNRIHTIDPYGNKSHYSYDNSSRLITVTDPLGFEEHYAYDCQGHVTYHTNKNGESSTTRSNIYGKPLTIHYPDGSEKRYRYNLDGHCIQEWERDGSFHCYEVDEEGRPTSTRTYSSDGTLIKSTTKRYKGERLIEEVDARGIATHYRYDSAGRLVATCRDGCTTHQRYDRLGRLSSTSRDNRIEVKEYDLLDRVIEERIEDVEGQLHSKKCYSYDINGNITSERIYHDADNYSETCTEYNSQSLPTRIVDPDGHVTTIRYSHSDHFEKSTTDSLGRTTVEIFDPLQRIATTRRYDADGQLTAQSHYSYDGEGHCIRQEESIIRYGIITGSFSITHSYDTMGNKIETTQQGDRTTRYRYHCERLDRITKPDGVSLHHSYDGLGRLLHLHSSDGTVDYSYCYDGNDNLLAVTDGVNGSVCRRRYDNHNRCIYECQANGLEVEYCYDEENRLTDVRFDDTAFTYSYNAAHLTAFACHHGATLAYRYCQASDWRGKPLEATLPCGTKIHYRWTPSGQLATINAPTYRSRLTYNSVGHIIAAATCASVGATFHNYSYDALDQLQEESGLFHNRYDHDSLHNRIAQDGVEQIVDHLNQLTRSGSSNYIYDSNGCRTAHGTATYRYDALDRLIEYGDAHCTIRYGYDAFGRRMQKQVDDASPTLYRYLLDTEVAAYRDGVCHELRALYRQHAFCAIELGGTPYSVIRNQRGDTCQLLDSHGHVAAGYHYDAYGLFTAYGSVTAPWLFTGQRYDGETQWYHFLKRSYDPAIGRWITPDPLGFADGPNLYAYVHNHPLDYIDPYGLSEEDARTLSGIFCRGFANDTTWGCSDYLLGECRTETFLEKSAYAAGTLSSLGVGLYYGNTEIKIAKALLKTTAKVSNRTFRLAKSAVNLARRQQNIQKSVKTLKIGEFGLMKTGPTLYQIEAKVAQSLGKTSKLAPTTFSSVRGWKVGDPVNNLTRSGKIPSWDAVRKRIYKNEAYYNPLAYNPRDLGRLRKGLASQKLDRRGNYVSMELHHMPPQRDGGLFDVIKVSPREHAKMDNFRRLGN